MHARTLTLAAATVLGALAGVVSLCAPALAAEPAARIDAESFSAGSTNATLSAQVDPLGTQTTVYFEYGTSTSYESSTSEVSLGAAENDEVATAEVSGLQPDTVYHFRAVAVNALGTVRGADAALTTYPPNAAALPDGRVYEMVTPVGNQDANVYVPAGAAGVDGVITRYPFQASLEGDAVAYVGDPSSGGNGDSGNGGGNEYLATRSPSGGWTQADIATNPPFNSATVSATEWPTYEAFSENLSVAILNSSQPLAAGVPAGYQDLYTRASSDGNYRSLLTVTPPHRTPIYFGGTNKDYTMGLASGPAAELLFAGASSDFSQLLFEANDTLTPEAIDGGQEENNLYKSMEGQLQLVNVLPNGSSEPNATFGAPANVEEADEPPDFSHVISTDGSRIFWTDLNTGDLYVREHSGTPQAQTVQVDASQGPGSGGGGKFWTASSDGTKVFFTDAAAAGLTDSTISGSGTNLYEYDVPSGRLTDLTPASRAEVDGVIGASEDGSYVYFVASGALAGAAKTGRPNLYLYHEGVTTFIAALSSRDNQLPQENPNFGFIGDWQPGLGHRTAEVTPDGQHLVFAAVESLTGYPNEGDQEVYTYDADTARLICVSCDPSGAPPPPVPYERPGIAALLPVSWSATHLPHWISDEGNRVFFDSLEPLVPQDTSDRQEVYEWEQDGTGTCRLSTGCVYLLSGGTSSDSYLVDASANGDNAFFVTRAQLVPQDRGDTFNLYDARVDGTIPLTPPQCSGTGCQGVPPAPPIFATPASATFEGVGNFSSPTAKLVRVTKTRTKVKRCGKGYVKKDGRCVKPRTKKSAKGRK